MAAFRIFRRLRQLQDVDDTGIAQGDVPTFDTAASKFTMAVPAAGNAHKVTLSGNTSGALALISTGTMTLAGGANITLSQAGNAVTISGAGGTQTYLGGISASDTLYTSGTVRLTGVGGGVTVSSNTGQRVDISVAAQSVQPETKTFIGGVSASDTLYTSGSVRITGVGGGITVSSNTGQRIDLSVAAPVAQTVQTQNVVDITLSGNTAGVMALVSSGTATLAGGNNITLSQAGNAITISGPNVAGAQTAISGLANSQTTYTSGTVSLSELGAITIRSTTGNQFQLSVNPQSVQVETQTFIAGVSASDTLYTSGNVRITGVGGGITVSSNTGQRVDLSVAAQTNQAGSVYASSNTFGTSSGTYDARSISIAGRGAVSVAASNSGWIISAPAQSVQAETQTFLAGAAASNTTYTSGTFTITGVGGGITVSSNTGQRIDLSVAAPVVQTNQSGNVYASSNTFGTSSGTYDARSISIAGRGAASVAASNSGWIISVPAQSVQAETQTFVGGIANSQTTYTSGTVSLSELGAITIRSTTGNQYQLSVNSQTAQTQGILAVGASTGGNTLGDTGVASGTKLVFVGTNNITISQGTAANATTLTISGPSVAGAQTGISGIANSQTTYTSGTVSLSELGAITIRSTTGNQYQLSVNAQTNQAGSVYGISNTSGTSSGTYDARTLSIAGAGIVTVAASNSGWRIDATTAAQTNQAGNVYASSNTFGTSSGTYDARSISIAGRGEISVAASNSGWIISSPVQTEQTQSRFNLTLSGNSTSAGAGYIQISSGVMTLAGGNNVTLSQNGNAVTVSAGGGVETQTAISGLANSQTTYTSGTVSLSELGAITIRSTTGNQFQLSVNSQTAQTQGILAVGASTGGNTAGDTGVASGTRLVLVGTNGITVSQGTAANATTLTLSGITQTVQTQGGFASLGVSTGGNTAGNTQVSTGSRFVLVGSGNLTLSQATAAGASTVTLSVAAQTAQTGISAISNSNTTFTSGTIGLSELGAITIRSTTGNQFQFSVNSQTVQTQNLVDVTLSGNTSGAQALISSGTLTLAGGNNITLSQAGNAVTISAPNLGAGAMSAGVSTGGNTAGATGITGTQMVLVGASNITLSQTTGANGGTVSFIAPVSSSLSATGIVSISTNGSTISVGAPPTLMGVSNVGNTGGATGATSTRMVFVGSDNITLSQTTGAAGGTISIFGPAAGGFSAGVSTGGNTAGATGVTGTRMVWVGTGPISLSQTTGAAGGTISINAPATSSLSATGDVSISTNGATISIGVPNITMPDWQNMNMGVAALLTHASGISKTPFYWNENLPADIRVNNLAIKISMVTATQPLSLSVHLGVYTLVNSTSANLLGSHSEAYVVSSATSVSLSGVRNVVMTGIGTHATLSTLTEGPYLFGMMFSGTQTSNINFSLYGAGSAGGPLGQLLPGTNNVSAGTSQGAMPMFGRGSTTVNAMPANVRASELVNQGQGASMQLHPWIYIRS